MKKLFCLIIAMKVPMHVYEGSNHSLETEDTRQDIKILQDVMRITMKYIK